MNKKERRLALATALQSAAGDMLVVESLKDQVEDRKTKTLVTLLGKLGVGLEYGNTLLILKERDEAVLQAGRNVARLTINTADTLKIFDILHCDKIVLEAGALEHIQAFYGGDKEEEEK